jgi:hypothetical protein
VFSPESGKGYNELAVRVGAKRSSMRFTTENLAIRICSYGARVGVQLTSQHPQAVDSRLSDPMIVCFRTQISRCSDLRRRLL